MNMMVSGQMTSGGEWLAAGWQRAEWLVSRRWFPAVVNIGALLLLAYGLATWTWALFRPQVPQVIPENTQQAPVVTFDLQSLLASQLFGQAPMAASQSLENIPISSLNLVLSGVVSAGGASYALISVNGQPPEPFAIGQEITGGAVLQAVYPDRVLLMRGGVSESLMLEGMSRGLPDAMVYPEVAPEFHGGALQQSGIVERGQNQYQVPRTLITEQMRKPQEIFSQALMVPNAGGGFLVREIQPGSLYEKLGLRVGDVIRSVNGRPVNNVDDAMQAYQRVSNQRDVRVEVVRGGQPATLQYSFQ